MTEKPANPETSKMTFDEKLNNLFRQTSHQAFLQVPEVRSILVIYDYFKDLNDSASVSKGFWVHTSGQKDKPIDSIVGTMGALLQSAAHVLDEWIQRHQQLQVETTQLANKLLEKKRELEAIEQEIEARKRISG